MQKQHLNNNLVKESKGVQLVQITAQHAGQRIDNYLFTCWKHVPKSRIYRAIRNGEVRVNKKRIKAPYRLQLDDVLRLPPIHQPAITKIAPPADKIEQLTQQILFEDEHLLIINKPAGIAVHAGSGESWGVIDCLQAAYGDEQFLELVHRLDKATSGCLMLAKSRAMLIHCHQALKQGVIEKTYLLLARGPWRGGECVIDEPLLKVSLGKQHFVKVSEQGKSAQTLFKWVAPVDEQTALLSAHPITGRTHQIRVHAQAMGSPLVGDEKYGDLAFNQDWKSKGIKQLCLHAYQLSFPDLAGKIVTCRAELMEKWGCWVDGKYQGVV